MYRTRIIVSFFILLVVFLTIRICHVSATITPEDSTTIPDSSATSLDDSSVVQDSIYSDTVSALFDTLLADTLPGEIHPKSDTNISVVADVPENNDNTFGMRKYNDVNISATASKMAFLKSFFRKIYNHSIIRWLRTHLLVLFIFGFVSGTVLSIMLFILKKTDKKRFMTTTRLSIMDKEVQKACRFIEKNYADTELGLEKICVNLITGEAFLEALFERELGISVTGFITQVRINRAKIMSHKNPDADVDRIAEETGFPDVTSFSCTFQEITGTDFETFRNAIRN